MKCTSEINRINLDFDTVKDEKAIFKPKRRANYSVMNDDSHTLHTPKEFLILWENTGMKDRRIQLAVDGFECSFMLSSVIDVKYTLEWDFITGKNHLFYVNEAEQERIAA